MSDSRKTLVTRSISAFLAGSLLICTGYFGGEPGLIVISLLVIGLAIREYSRMQFRDPQQWRSFRWFFITLCVLLTAALTLLRLPTATALAVAMSILIVGGLWLTRNKISNEQLLPLLGLSSLGLIYCVYFPVFAIFLAQIKRGPVWFLFLMAVVFAGDTFAYFGGRFFGRHKLMPQISPNKTMEGAVAGLVGSCLAGTLIAWHQIPEVSLVQVVLFSAICGFVAQAGDLFMSLAKRVANVKDSGQIMPGHGGILDRLDGVFIACPLVYAFALYCQAGRI